jgi:NAD(P)-dependent dehydrogenase (short-subunit alcohol dehydrogenase family)
MAGTMLFGQLSPGIEFSLATTPSAELHTLPLFTSSPLTPSNAYGLAKRANQLRVRAASLTWGARGARVNGISPGLILTAIGQQELAGASGDLIRTMIHDAPISRVGTAGEIANVAAFLLSPDASYITGTDILVDGGVIASIHRDRSSLIAATAPMVPAS